MISRSLKKNILRMSLGIILYEIFLTVVCYFFSKVSEYSFVSLVNGVIVGTVLTYILLINIGIVNEDVLSSNNSEFAQKRTIFFGILRKIVIIVIIAFFWNSNKVNVLAIVMSIFALKPGAYLVPVADKVFSLISRDNGH